MSRSRLSHTFTGAPTRRAATAAIAAKFVACDSFPPKPPPIRGTSTTTWLRGQPRTSATAACTSVGCCVELHTCIDPNSPGAARDACVSR